MNNLIYRLRCTCGSSKLMDAWYREKNEIGVVCMNCCNAGPTAKQPKSGVYSYKSANNARYLWNNYIISLKSGKCNNCINFEELK